ncbi:MAG: MFS transporter [Dehalococcoidia bacterium]|nr:MFS transporter [Dehalococcoidia bacterium]
MRWRRPPTPYTFRERWRFRNQRPTNHPRTSYQTRVWGTTSQRWFYVDGVVSAIVDVALVQFLAVYAIALGATDAEVGLLSVAAGLAGFLALVPGARIAELTNSRRWVTLVGGAGIGRIAVLVMALGPTFVRAPNDAVYLLIAMAFVRSFAINVSHASWVSLLADIIPLDLRRFYVAQRMLAITVAGAVTAPLIGFGIRAIGGVQGYQVMFGFAFAAGIAAWYAYFRIQEPARPARAERPRGSTSGMLRDRRFIRYLGALLVLNAATMVVGPFFLAYFVRDLGGSVSDVGLLATLEQSLAVGAQFLLALWVTRFNTERLFKVSLFLPALIPAAWLLVQEPWQAAVPFGLGGIGWAIYNVALFNLLMEYAPNQNIPRYAALQQTVIFFANLIGPVTGTLVVAAWGIRTAMVISTVGRILGALMMFIPLRWIPALPAPAAPVVAGAMNLAPPVSHAAPPLGPQPEAPKSDAPPQIDAQPEPEAAPDVPPASEHATEPPADGE